MNKLPKIVFKKTLKQSDWENTTLATGDIVDEITKLKNQDGKDIIVGANFVSELIKNRLIDEFHFFINPTLIGDGMAIFKGITEKQHLKLKKAIGFDCGISVLHYDLK